MDRFGVGYFTPKSKNLETLLQKWTGQLIGPFFYKTKVDKYNQELSAVFLRDNDGYAPGHEDWLEKSPKSVSNF